MNRNNKVHIYYLAISRDEETSENCESFSELKDLYRASVNPQALPEGLNGKKIVFVTQTYQKIEIMLTLPFRL